MCHYLYLSFLQGILYLCKYALALHDREVNSFDYTLKSAGHGYGGVNFVRHNFDGTGIITSSSLNNPFTSYKNNYISVGKLPGQRRNINIGCNVSLRNATNGVLLWRRDVCSRNPNLSFTSQNIKSSINIQHAIYVPSNYSINSQHFYSLDNMGLFRKWDQRSGAILTERSLPISSDYSEDIPRIFGLGNTVIPVYTTSDSGGDVVSFSECSNLLARDVLEGSNIKAPISSVARYFGIIPAVQNPSSKNNSDKFIILAGWVTKEFNTISSDTTSFGQMASLEIKYSKSQLNKNSDDWSENQSTFQKNDLLCGNIETKQMNYKWDILKSRKVHHSPSSFAGSQSVLASSIRYVKITEGVLANDSSYLLGITSSRHAIQFYLPEMRVGQTIDMVSFQNPMWSYLQSVEPICTYEKNIGSMPYGPYKFLRLVGGNDLHDTLEFKTSLVSIQNMTLLHPYFNKGNGYNDKIHDGLTVCRNVVLIVESKENKSLHFHTPVFFKAFYYEEENGKFTYTENIEIFGDKSFSINGKVKNVHLVKCFDNGMEIILTTICGGTHHISVDFVFSYTDLYIQGDSAKFSEAKLYIREKWNAEESVGSVTSAVLIDDSHPLRQFNLTEEIVFERLSYRARLITQILEWKDFLMGGFMKNIKSIVGLTSLSTTKLLKKDYNFGYAKIAVLLSSPLAKVLGTDTLLRGKMKWSLNLNHMADWHMLVNGGTISRSAVFRRDMKHTQSHWILLLSHVTKYSSSGAKENATFSVLEWYCVDGLNGNVYSKSFITLSSPVAQVAPFYADVDGGDCIQNAILLHDDDTITIIPENYHGLDDNTVTMLPDDKVYMHKVDVDKGLLSSFKIISLFEKNNVSATVVGRTSFDPSMEKIVGVTYPQRNEVIHSPATILGDDSLLLKYLNPHLCVVVTEATSTFLNQLEYAEKTKNSTLSLYKSLSKRGLGATREVKSIKKPIGANNRDHYLLSDPYLSSSVTSQTGAIPSLFINLVDTVSGQILHRVSHIHTSHGKKLSTPHVPVIISENWVIYAFKNTRNRRTELGVFTLHEGMIDRKGLTVFTAPDQEKTFSSMSNPKPIVLSKTYVLPKPVVTIGVTKTKSGITSKNVLFGTGICGQIVVMDRKWLDPRRPTSEPKYREIKEGLMKYSPLLPITPAMIASHANDISFVSSIITTSTNLESQSLVIGVGGHDIFFTRLAPSKRFDSLPEDFNKPILFIVLFGLLILTITVRHRRNKTIFQTFWS